MSDPRPRYAKGQRLKMDPRDVWAATRRPPNVSEKLTSTFSDLYWKSYAVVHHASRVIELEQQECAALVESLKEQPGLVGIAQTCSSSLRFEYEAMLGVSYAAQSLLARATIESLTGTTLEEKERLPSFAVLDREIARIGPRPEMDAARDRVLAKLAEIRTWDSPDFLASLSPRHRITHREHVRCSPIFVHRMPGLQMKPDRNEPLGVTFACREPVNALSHYAPEIETGYILLVRQDHQAPPPAEILLSPPREIEGPGLPMLSKRALQVAQQHLLAAALLIDALSEGPEAVAGIITRQDAAQRAKLSEDEQVEPEPSADRTE
jgi:hypothetical protein